MIQQKRDKMFHYISRNYHRINKSLQKNLMANLNLVDSFNLKIINFNDKAFYTGKPSVFKENFIAYSSMKNRSFRYLSLCRAVKLEFLKMELHPTCLKCNNFQPVFRQCSKCYIIVRYTCVGDDCWGFDWRLSEKMIFWICSACQYADDKENKAPNNLYQVFDIKGSYTEKKPKTKFKEICLSKQYFTMINSPNKKDPTKKNNVCSVCDNVQPVTRKCVNCDCTFKYMCVGSDCWDIKPPSPRKKAFWICYVCKPDYKKRDMNAEYLDLKYSIEIDSDKEEMASSKMDLQETKSKSEDSTTTPPKTEIKSEWQPVPSTTTPKSEIKSEWKPILKKQSTISPKTETKVEWKPVPRTISPKTEKKVEWKPVPSTVSPKTEKKVEWTLVSRTLSPKTEKKVEWTLVSRTVSPKTETKVERKPVPRTISPKTETKIEWHPVPKTVSPKTEKKVEWKPVPRTISPKTETKIEWHPVPKTETKIEWQPVQRTISPKTEKKIEWYPVPETVSSKTETKAEWKPVPRTISPKTKVKTNWKPRPLQDVMTTSMYVSNDDSDDDDNEVFNIDSYNKRKTEKLSDKSPIYEDRDYDESEIFDVNPYTVSEVYKNTNLDSNKSTTPDTKQDEDKKCEDIDEAGYVVVDEETAPMLFHAEEDEGFVIVPSPSHEDPSKKFLNNLAKWESLNLQDIPTSSTIRKIFSETNSLLKKTGKAIATEVRAVNALTNRTQVFNEELKQITKISSENVRRLRGLWENGSDKKNSKSDED